MINKSFSCLDTLLRVIDKFYNNLNVIEGSIKVSDDILRGINKFYDTTDVFKGSIKVLHIISIPILNF